MRRLLACTLILVALSGCAFTLQRYDPVTVEQIEMTIDFEVRDYALSAEALMELGAPDMVIASLALRHKAELARLHAWLLAEQAKKTEK